MRDLEERTLFFQALLARCIDYRQSCLTLTAIHPAVTYPVPSRHISLDDETAFHEALTRLDAVNALGWGAYFAVGLRCAGLTRWQRGGSPDVVALPALFVDVDDSSAETLTRLQRANPTPSCIVYSGGGYHTYWWLEEPTSNMRDARLVLRGLADAFGGDKLSIAQSLRLVGSINTKPERHQAHCHIVELNEWRYALDAFDRYKVQAVPQHTYSHTTRTTAYTPNPDLVARITHTLIQRGGKLRNHWVNVVCPFPERHKHGDSHPSFGFNPQSGYGYCHVCGTLLLKDLSARLF
jgi:hypothetical protein